MTAKTVGSSESNMKRKKRTKPFSKARKSDTRDNSSSKKKTSWIKKIDEDELDSESHSLHSTTSVNFHHQYKVK